MFLRRKTDAAMTKIYRDARPVALLIASPCSVVLYGAFTELPNGPELFGVVAFLLAGIAFMWLVTWWVLHGAIVLNRRTSSVEFTKSFGLQKNGAAYPIREIDWVKVQTLAASNPGAGAIMTKSSRIVLGSGTGEKALNIWFTSERDAADAAVSIAEFANKPAFDSRGDSLFAPQ